MHKVPTLTKDFRKIEDIGLDGGAAKLDEKKIQQVVKQVLDNETSARFEAYMDTCVHCGLCADACHYCLSHDGDPSYSPVGKMSQTIWEIVKRKGKVSPEFMRNAVQIAHTECNLCRRCMHYCPIGIDVAYMMTIVRRLGHKLGLTPQYIQDTCHSHSATGNQMWVKDDEWIDSLFWQEEEARDEFPEMRIPVEKEGAEMMYSVIAPEPKFRTHLIYQAAAIMHEARVDWTMPATPGWDNSDMAMFTGDNETMGRLKRMHYETAHRLRVKRIVMGECGHAFRSVYDVGNRWLAWRDTPIEMVHGVQFYWEMLTSGRIKVGSQIEDLVTFHDPCNIVRGRGLEEKGREVAKAFCPNFVEMTPNREHNICCCAGGGVINCGPPFKKTRIEGNSVKAEQLRATGAKIVIAPCHNCHGGLEDIIHHYKLDMKLMFLGDIIYEHMQKTRAIEEG
ncbi:electron transfer complex ferredoxin TmcB [Desulfohalovibrio reitneri]|uniref:electron transfer complex ferredoxin TmcB n=1 Tax=Desulfohalovibrio reitneri TaxID=1307759 RepID=UPI0004A76027|nr:(Fe-S)-binding protein [Desulfohalovibrio reitneri]